jgi:HEAT repeat protein
VATAPIAVPLAAAAGRVAPGDRAGAAVRPAVDLASCLRRDLPGVTMPRVLPSGTWRRGVPASLLACALALGCGRGRDLDAQDPERRAAAVRALPASPPGRALPALLVAQADPSAAVRRAAAETFARIGDPHAAESLAALVVDVDREVAAAAAAGLAQLPAAAGGRERLLTAYAGATTEGRAAIADALDWTGVALREAIEAEARVLWERNAHEVDKGAGPARAGAAEELGASGRTEAVTRLVALLEGPGRTDRRLAAAAARGLGAAGHRTARPRLELLLEVTDREVAVAAAEALQRLGDPGAADALAAAAEGAGPAAGAALRALESLPRAPEVGTALCAVAVRSGEPGRAALAARLATARSQACPVRPLLARLGLPGEVAALAALAELRLDPADAEAPARRLLALLGSGQGSPETRAATARALGGLGWPGAREPLEARAAALAKKLAEPAARPGAGPQAPATPPPLPTVLVESPAAAELGAVLVAAARLGSQAIDPTLEPALTGGPALVRAGAAEALALRRRGAAVPLLSAALEDPDLRVRVASARALGRLGAPGAGPLVRAAGATHPEEVGWRIELASALAEAGGPEAAAGLAELLDGDSTAAAAAAFARLGTSSGTAPLMRLVARPSAPALPEAIEALSQIAGLEAGPVIARHLTSDRFDVREAAVRALGRLRYEPAAVTLEALRSDYSGRIRRAAIEALAKLPVRRPGGRP